MPTFTMIYLHGVEHDIYHFKSDKKGIDGLTFGGVDFAAELVTAEMNGIDRDEFDEDHPGWEFVQRLLVHFDITFEPDLHEYIMIDMVPDEIELEIS